MAADRAQHVASEIEPALARGDWVVCDRYVPSSLVYQGVVRGLGVEVVEQLSVVATAGLAPDLVLLLDVSDEIADARRADESRAGVDDRLEREGVRVPRFGARRVPRARARTRLDRGRCRRRRRSCRRARSRRGSSAAGRMTAMVATEHWARVPGQERAVTQLQRAATRPVHAYLLVGPRGSGVEEAARCFAAALITTDDDERSWDLVLRGVHPDVVEIDPPATQIRIEDAQAVVDEVSRSPIEGERKVVVLFDAERLRLNESGRQQAAQDARGTAAARGDHPRHVGRRSAAPHHPLALPACRLRVPRSRRGRGRARRRRHPRRARRAARPARGRPHRPRPGARRSPRPGAGRVRRRGLGDRRHRRRGRRAGRARAGGDAGARSRTRSGAGRRKPRSWAPSSRPRATRSARGAHNCAGSRSVTSARTGAPASTRCSKASPRSRPSTATRWPDRPTSGSTSTTRSWR